MYLAHGVARWAREPRQGVIQLEDCWKKRRGYGEKRVAEHGGPLQPAVDGDDDGDPLGEVRRRLQHEAALAVSGQDHLHLRSKGLQRGDRVGEEAPAEQRGDTRADVADAGPQKLRAARAGLAAEVAPLDAGGAHAARGRVEGGASASGVPPDDKDVEVLLPEADDLLLPSRDSTHRRCAERAQRWRASMPRQQPSIVQPDGLSADLRIQNLCRKSSF